MNTVNPWYVRIYTYIQGAPETITERFPIHSDRPSDGKPIISFMTGIAAGVAAMNEIETYTVDDYLDLTHGVSVRLRGQISGSEIRVSEAFPA